MCCFVDNFFGASVMKCGRLSNGRFGVRAQLASPSTPVLVQFAVAWTELSVQHILGCHGLHADTGATDHMQRRLTAAHLC